MMVSKSAKSQFKTMQCTHIVYSQTPIAKKPPRIALIRVISLVYRQPLDKDNGSVIIFLSEAHREESRTMVKRGGVVLSQINKGDFPFKFGLIPRGHPTIGALMESTRTGRK
jgi:hypothetical protein